MPTHPLSTHSEAIIAPALTLVPRIMRVLSSDMSNDSKQNAVNMLTDMALAENKPAESVYLACLIKAYVFAHLHYTKPVHSFLIANDLFSHAITEQSLTTFIQGDYTVRAAATNASKLVMEEERVYINRGPRGPVIAFGLNDASPLALWKICETELVRAYGDDDLGKRLAASTALMMLENRDTCHGQAYLAKRLCSSGINPFRHARIFEFAGNDDALIAGNNVNTPLATLFAAYRDYTPDHEYVTSRHHPSYISKENPGPLFSQAATWCEGDHYDYAIASNVFCYGAVKGNTGKMLISELLPYLAETLKDSGRLIISNTNVDGYDVALYVGGPSGLFCKEELVPTFPAACEESGLTVLERSHFLKPPQSHGHIARLAEHAERRSAGGWCIDL